MDDANKLTLAWIDPTAAQENPLQWRLHPETQMAALDSLIFDQSSPDYVGWAGAALINQRRVEDGWSEAEAVPTLVDGHGRAKQAAERGQQIPALVGHWTPEQEKTILATLDPLAGLAGIDINKQVELLTQVVAQSDGLAGLVDAMRDEALLMQQLEQFQFDSPDDTGEHEGKVNAFRVIVRDEEQFLEVIETVKLAVADYDAEIKI